VIIQVYPEVTFTNLQLQEKFHTPNQRKNALFREEKACGLVAVDTPFATLAVKRSWVRLPSSPPLLIGVHRHLFCEPFLICPENCP